MADWAGEGRSLLVASKREQGPKRFLTPDENGPFSPSESEHRRREPLRSVSRRAFLAVTPFPFVLSSPVPNTQPSCSVSAPPAAWIAPGSDVKTRGDSACGGGC